MSVDRASTQEEVGESEEPSKFKGLVVLSPGREVAIHTLRSGQFLPCGIGIGMVGANPFTRGSNRLLLAQARSTKYLPK